MPIGKLEGKTDKESVLPKIKFGNSEVYLQWNNSEQKAVFNFFDENFLTIKKEKGQLKITTYITKQNGDRIAELVNNEWKINPGKIFDRKYTKDSLEIKDEKGDIVFQVKLFKNYIQLQGKFYNSKGDGVALGSEVYYSKKNSNSKVIVSKPGENIEEGEIVGVIERTGLEHPELLLKIESIFK